MTVFVNYFRRLVFLTQVGVVLCHMQIIYQDNHLLVVNKPAGQLVQGDQTGRSTLLEEAKTWLKETFNKPGNVFLGLVHRLDRPASGVVVLARTSKAAARLSEEIRSRRPRKGYWALVKGEVPERGQWIDRLERDEYTSRVVVAQAGKEARLSYSRLKYERGISLVEIDLETGRHHQIRVQFANRGFPILGDRRYGSVQTFAGDSIALHARRMIIVHPILHKEMLFIADPAQAWQPFIDTIKDERESPWQVYRMDDNGNRFELAHNLTEQGADELIRDYEVKDHKQTYCKEMQNA